jgi:serine protease inhibitor
MFNNQLATTESVVTAPPGAGNVVDVAAGADFGLALLGKLMVQQQDQQEISSLVVSPFSLACVLALVHGGARGRTAEQLAKVLAGNSQSKFFFLFIFVFIPQIVGLQITKFSLFA